MAVSTEHLTIVVLVEVRYLKCNQDFKVIFVSKAPSDKKNVLLAANLYVTLIFKSILIY